MQKKRKQVTRACKKCKQSHACCDNQRPCSRCVNLGIADSCCDSEQKKRGRKRKEDEVQETPTQKKKPEFKQEQTVHGSVWQTNFRFEKKKKKISKNLLKCPRGLSYF